MDPVEIEFTKAVKQLVKHVKKEECILFLGAGVHAPPPDGSRYVYPEEQRPPLGGDLAKRLAAECDFEQKFPDESPRDLQRVSLCFEKTAGLGRSSLVDFLDTHLKVGKKPSPILKMLAALPFRIIVTTNYDQLLENALVESEKHPVIFVYNPHLDEPTPDMAEDPTAERPLVFKMYGDIDRPDSIVITDEDYITFSQRMSAREALHPVPQIIRFRMRMWPTLFVGYSLRDYNLRLLFRSLRWRSDVADFPPAFIVDRHPDPLTLQTWQNERRFATFITQDLWTFVAWLRQEVQYAPPEPEPTPAAPPDPERYDEPFEEAQRVSYPPLGHEPTLAALPGLGRYGEPDGPRQRFDEVIAGISIGAVAAPAHTITALVSERGTDKPLLLLPRGTLSPGAEVIQPAPVHGGNDQDKIGVVDREILNETCVAAVARLEGERAFLSTLPNGQPIAGVIEPTRGLHVCKFGGESGYTRGTIISVNESVRLPYDDQREIELQDGFLIAEPGFSRAGDIGALVVTVDGDNQQAIGVIVGHSEGEDQGAFCLPIRTVLDQLGVDLITRRMRYVRGQRVTDRIVATLDVAYGEDRLGFTHYVNAFVRLVEDTDPPLTVGIYGAWGTGKTFLMNMIAKGLGYEHDRELSFQEKILGPVIAIIVQVITWSTDKKKKTKDEQADDDWISDKRASARHGDERHRKLPFWKRILGPVRKLFASKRAAKGSAGERVGDKRTTQPSSKPTSAEGANKAKKFSLRQAITRLLQIKALVVWFEAWDYNGCDKLWAGLVERIFRSIEESRLGLYGQIRINLLRNLEHQWRTFRARLLPYTLISIIIGVLVFALFLSDQAAWAALVGSSAGLVLLVRELTGILFTPASKRIADLFTAPDYEDDLGFMRCIRQDLQGFAKSLPAEMKVIVFIDDLDRCDPEKAVEVLEAIKLLLDFDRFIVFLALDARIITQAIEEHYGQVLTEAEITGYEYLDKIVQIPFSIPEPPPNELRKYVGSLVGLGEADVPPIETVVPEEAKVEKEQQFEFAAEPVALESDVEGMGQIPPAEAPPSTDGAAEATQEEPVASTGSLPPLPITPSEIEELSSEDKGPPDEGEKIEVQVDTSEVTFTRAEQEVFLDFYSHLDPNPRRIKRLVNIYRLVRTLIASRRQALEPGGARAMPDLPEDPRHILGWLILCEQWPYAAHIMLDVLDRSLKLAESNHEALSMLLSARVMQLYDAGQVYIAQDGDEALKKLDLKYDRLQSFVETHIADLTLADVQRLRTFTVNFNPALSAEVRLTLSSEGR